MMQYYSSSHYSLIKYNNNNNNNTMVPWLMNAFVYAEFGSQAEIFDKILPLLANSALSNEHDHGHLYNCDIN